MRGDLKQFVLRIALLSALFLAVTTLYNYMGFPGELYTKYLGIIIMLATEAYLLFFLVFRKRLGEIRVFPVNPKELAVFLVPALLLLIARLYMEPSPYRKFLTLGAFLSIAIGVFGFEFARDFQKRFRKEILLAVALFLALNALMFFFQYTWIYTAAITATIVYHLLTLTFGQATLSLGNPNIPVVGAGEFIAGIRYLCSGIESLALFSFFYFLAIALDFEKMRKKLVPVAFIIGLLGIYLLMVLRIYLIIFIGAAIDAGLAMTLVHNAISLVLFVLYFIAFWFLAFKWLRK